MGRRKRDYSYAKPFCYYCDKTFNNEIVLHQHQKGKHFTCDFNGDRKECKKKFPTTASLFNHCKTEHQMDMEKFKIPNALEGRNSPDLNIFGMTNVPRKLIEETTMDKAIKYWKKVKEERQLKLDPQAADAAQAEVKKEPKKKTKTVADTFKVKK